MNNDFLKHKQANLRHHSQGKMNHTEVKPAIVNQQCLVYQFQCNLCDAGYVGYTRGHLHKRVDGHKQKSSSICKHYLSEHNSVITPFISEDTFYKKSQTIPKRAGGLDSRKGIHLKNL